MKERIIEIEADSLEEARRKLYTHELIVLEESILYHGKVETIEAIADTVEGAFRKAQSKVPAGAKTETRKVRLSPKRITLLVQAEDEEGAGKGKAELIASVSLSQKGRKGFWGIGKTSDVYEVVLSQPAVVELTFREKAKIRARVRDYFGEDLLENLQIVRERNAQWAEILELLNPKGDSEIQAWLIRLHELNPVSALDAIENACRKNEKTNWQIVIKEAHTQASIARARELREQEITLRELDVKIADSFGLYTSLDWFAKSQKEPTGYLDTPGIMTTIAIQMNDSERSFRDTQLTQRHFANSREESKGRIFTRSTCRYSLKKVKRKGPRLWRKSALRRSKPAICNSASCDHGIPEGFRGFGDGIL